MGQKDVQEGTVDQHAFEEAQCRQPFRDLFAQSIERDQNWACWEGAYPRLLTHQRASATPDFLSTHLVLHTYFCKDLPFLDLAPPLPNGVGILKTAHQCDLFGRPAG